MKNLKKVLSLVLALAMALSLMTVAFAADAKDYADYGEVNYNEAVDVMTDVGVFDGMNGSFNPDGTLTREQAAKIITYMLMGKSDADKLTTTIAPYSDVSASRWSAGAIAYCTNEGIISGMGHNKFAPTDEVTGLQFAKMLLVALGYDAEIEELVGDSWAINTSKLAIAVGLDNGMEEISLSGDLTREQAAQMAFNAMQAPLVEYGSKGTTIEVNGATVTFGAQQAQYVTTTIAKTQTISNTKLSNSNDYTIEFAEQYCQDLRKLDGDTDAFERPATTWRLKNADIGTYADTPDLTYTGATKIGTIYNDLGLTRGISKADTTVYEDGILSTSKTSNVAWTDFDIVKGQTAKIGGDGSQMDIYYDVENGTVTIVVVNTYVAKVAAARAATSTRDAYVTLDVSDAFTGPGGNYDTTAFAKDDIVAYTYSYKTGEKCIESMAKAEAVTGAMSTYTTTGSVTVAGTKYDANVKSAVNIANFVTSVDKGSDVTVYLDAYGYALYVDADVAVNYAVVLNYTANAGDFNNTPKAELLFTDGTVKTVEVQKNITTGSTGFVNPVNGNVVYEAGLTKYDVVSYTVNSKDVYTINVVADAQDGKDGGAFVMQNGSNTFSIVDSNKANVNGSKSTHYADGKTIFLVADTSNPNKTVYSAYEGIANMPSITKEGTSNAAVTVFMDSTTNDNPATVVFIQKDANMRMASDNKDIIYVKGSNVGTSYTTDLGTFYEYDAYINGESTTVKVSTAMQMTSDALIYGPVYDEKGVMTGYEDRVSSAFTNDGSLRYTTKTDSVVNDVVKLGGTPYAYTNDVKVYFMNVDGTLVASDITAIVEDNNDAVFYKLNDKGLLTDVYVKVVDQPETVNPGAGVLKSVAISINGAKNMIADVDLTSNAPAGGTPVTVKVEKYMESTNTWMEVSTKTLTIAAGTDNGSVLMLDKSAMANGEIYRVSASYNNDTVSSSSNLTVSGLA